MISSHRIPLRAIYVSSGHSASALFEKGEGVEEESNKNAWKGERTVKKSDIPHANPLCTFSVTQSFLLVFS